MGRLHHLQHTLPYNLEANYSLPVEFVLVDYNSKDGLSEWVKTRFPTEILSGKLSYYRTNAPSRFNPPHAKNIAHRQATGKIVCNLDADNFAPAEFTEYLFDGFKKNRKQITHGFGAEGFFGRIALMKEWFVRLGGYDESLGVRWGYEDSDLIKRAVCLGLSLHRLPDRFATVLNHTDSERVYNLALNLTPTESHGLNAQRSRQNIVNGRYVANERDRWGQASLVTMKVPANARTVHLKRTRQTKKTCFVTVASRPARYFEQFMVSCRRQEVYPVILGMGSQYDGNGLKIKYLKEFINTHGARYSHIVFCDAFDAVLTSSLEEILANFKLFNTPIVFSAERNCFPNAARRIEYPEVASPYKYLNSGVWVGDLDAAQAMFERIDVTNLSNRKNDQAVFTDLFLSHEFRIKLDYECRIAQSLFLSEGDVEIRKGRLRNKLSGHCPCIIHGNGGVNMTPMLAKLRFLDVKRSLNTQRVEKLLSSHLCEYQRVGYDRRPMQFLPDGSIGQGKGGCETNWRLQEEDKVLFLEIFSTNGLTCRLYEDRLGVWKGCWERFEKMPIELTPFNKIS